MVKTNTTVTEETKKIVGALIETAKNLAIKRILSHDCRVGDVGCALRTDRNDTFVGVSIHCACGIGCCAEHSAVANMITNGQTRVDTIVAVNSEGQIMPPCGRCRELLIQIDDNNRKTVIVLGPTQIISLDTLLPYRWQEVRN
ncbi:MAG: cytidine deaminase [Deltaproteobacteria bacterium]|nr:cytidine deaminase [Deltaproteobacteria bacterium]